MSQDEKVKNALRDTIVTRINLVKHKDIGPDETLENVLTAMVKNRFGCVLVKEGKEVVGVFTERDVLTKIAGENHTLSTPIKEFMRTDVKTLPDSATLEEAVNLMNKHKFRRLPIVDSSGECIGILFGWQVVEFLVEYFQEEVYHLPPDYKQVFDTEEGG